MATELTRVWLVVDSWLDQTYYFASQISAIEFKMSQPEDEQKDFWVIEKELRP